MNIAVLPSRTGLALALLAVPLLWASASPQGWQEEFSIAGRTLSTTGRSKYFVLVPGYQLTLADEETTLTFRVLNETRKIGNVVTRVVEEKEVVGGAVTEIARDFYAMDQKTGDVFHFGEDVDAYEQGKIVNHTGSWMAYKNGARPGLLVPGKPSVGMRYYQELAPGVATDRAEVTSLTGTLNTPAGQFGNCLVVRASSKDHPTEFSGRTYAPNIGLAQFESLKLTGYGMRK